MEPSSSSGGTNYVIPKEGLGTEKLPGNLNSRLGEVEDLSKNILTLVVVSLVGIVISVVVGAVAIIVDQLHFNNEIYRDGGYNHIRTIEKTNTNTVEIQEQPIVFPNMKPSQ